MDVIMYFRPRGCPKKDKICGSWIGALGGYAGVLYTLPTVAIVHSQQSA